MLLLTTSLASTLLLGSLISESPLMTRYLPGSRAILANSSVNSEKLGRLSASIIQPDKQIHYDIICCKQKTRRGRIKLLEPDKLWFVVERRNDECSNHHIACCDAWHSNLRHLLRPLISYFPTEADQLVVNSLFHPMNPSAFMAPSAHIPIPSLSHKTVHRD